MIITGDVIKVTTEIEDRDMLNKVYKVEYVTTNGNIDVMHEGDLTTLKTGEFITLTEEETMIELFTQLTGEAPKETKLDETLAELDRVQAELDQAKDYIRQLEEDLNNVGGNY